MRKLAYLTGTARALSDLGLIKRAEDDPASQTHEDVAPQQNPAELLADIFQKAEIALPKQGPDNKTKPENDAMQQDKSVKWGPQVTGTGGEALERIVPGLNMPMISSI